MRQDPLYLHGNDDFPQSDITTRDTADVVVPATGLTGITIRLSATPNGLAIHSSLSVAASELAGKPGTYRGLFLGTDINTHLAAYNGKDVYQVTGDAAHVNVGSIARRVMVRP